VPLIESGVVDGPELEGVARGYLEPLMERPVDAVVLGCTHYPLVSEPINRILGPEVRLISSAGQTALEVGRVLSRRDTSAGRAARTTRAALPTSAAPTRRSSPRWVGVSWTRR
jgi:glutamate racemase